MLISPGEVLVGAYFKRHRSLALSLAKCGASIGNITVPPLVTFLLQEYGLAGTLLLYGGVCLNRSVTHRPCVGVCVIRSHTRLSLSQQVGHSSALCRSLCHPLPHTSLSLSTGRSLIGLV